MGLSENGQVSAAGLPGRGCFHPAVWGALAGLDRECLSGTPTCPAPVEQSCVPLRPGGRTGRWNLEMGSPLLGRDAKAVVHWVLKSAVIFITSQEGSLLEWLKARAVESDGLLTS